MARRRSSGKSARGKSHSKVFYDREWLIASASVRSDDALGFASSFVPRRPSDFNLNYGLSRPRQATSLWSAIFDLRLMAITPERDTLHVNYCSQFSNEFNWEWSTSDVNPIVRGSFLIAILLRFTLSPSTLKIRAISLSDLSFPRPRILAITAHS